MTLYKFNHHNDVRLVESKRFRYRSLAQERMVADDFAERLGYKSGEGIIVVQDENGMILKQLDITV